MNKKYMVIAAVGVGFLLLILIAGALFYTGNDEAAGATAAAVAVGAAAVASGKRKKAKADLDGLSEEAAASINAAAKLESEVDEEFAKVDTDVGEKPLSDLVDEENA